MAEAKSVLLRREIRASFYLANGKCQVISAKILKQEINSTSSPLWIFY
jgi:hypothetical protein